MIKAGVFVGAFDGAFAERARQTGLIRQRSTTSKWLLRQDGGDLHFQFRVNPKASAIPHWPGEFWAEVTWDGPRHHARDDGTVSYYQYTSAAENDAIQALARGVLDKVASRDAFASDVHRAARDAMLDVIRSGLDMPPEPRLPGYGLYYLDTADASSWGAWFSQNVPLWIRRFQAAPETLESWCWRVLWRDLPRDP